jgi:tetratricopeptide (TPR) repeat protein
MASGREDWQSHRQDMQGNRQDFRNNNREDWQNWANGNMHHHGGWYHGCWNGGWHPGAGWGYMWNHYPVATAFGLTAWGVNRVAYGWGYWNYSNPYATSTTTSASYDYSQPIIIYSDGSSTGGAANSAPANTAASTTPPQPADEALSALTDARAAFSAGDSAKALALLDTVLKSMPNDTVVHEFRGLVLFSMKKYPEAAAATYAVLSAGPGWNWTTMSGLYPSVDEYTLQLRTLEDFSKANPKSADAHFLLGYHYLTNGFDSNALKQFQQAQSELPNDRLLTQLIGMTTASDEPKPSDKTPPEPLVVPPEKVLKSEQLVGTWKATSQGATFQLDLAKDGAFTWTYSRGQEKQSVKGVFAVDQNNLALEVDDGSAMLAEVDLQNPSEFLFKMIGGDEKDPGLQFKKG